MGLHLSGSGQVPDRVTLIVSDATDDRREVHGVSIRSLNDPVAYRQIEMGWSSGSGLGRGRLPVLRTILTADEVRDLVERIVSRRVDGWICPRRAEGVPKVNAW